MANQPKLEQPVAMKDRLSAEFLALQKWAETNLVICQDHAYHKLLHRRARALRESGHADWLRCPFCKRYDAPENMYVPAASRQSARHPACFAAYMRAYKRARRVA